MRLGKKIWAIVQSIHVLENKCPRCIVKISVAEKHTAQNKTIPNELFGIPRRVFWVLEPNKQEVSEEVSEDLYSHVFCRQC